MRKINWSPEALHNLADVFDYIAERDLHAAISLNQRILDEVELLAQFPLLHRAGRVRGTRELVIPPNYLVVYQPDPAAVEILAVINTRKKYPPIQGT